MPRELIHVHDHRSQLHCDNPRCGYDLPEGTVTWGEHLIGYPCPKCDSNMLTRKDYETSECVHKTIRWLNKWFGWLGSKTLATDPTAVTMSVRHHDGTTIIKYGAPTRC